MDGCQGGQVEVEQDQGRDRDEGEGRAKMHRSGMNYGLGDNNLRSLATPFIYAQEVVSPIIQPVLLPETCQAF